MPKTGKPIQLSRFAFQCKTTNTDGEELLLERVAVRRVNEWDGPAMLKIYAPHVAAGLAPEEGLPPLADYIQRIDRYTYGMGWLLCEINSTPAGFCHLQEDPGAPENPFRAEVQLYVKPEFQRRGVGTALLSLLTAMNHYQNRRLLRVGFSSQSPGMTNFLRRQGFVPSSAGRTNRLHQTQWMEKEILPQDPEAQRVTKPYLIENADYEAARERAALCVHGRG